MTFSIVAQCSRTDMVGVAVSTAVPAVGSLCSFSAARVGALSAQAWVNPYPGIDGLALLRAGLDARHTLEHLLADDPGRASRQLGIVDADGQAAAYTGADCPAWAGHRLGAGYSVQGNLLTGGVVMDAMAARFEATTEQDLPERLMQALEAGQRVGGDRRGRQSAAIRVHDMEEYPYVDVRVDEHPDPVAELRRVWNVARQQLLPLLRLMPTPDNPLGRHDPRLTDFIMLSPQERAALPGVT